MARRDPRPDDLSDDDYMSPEEAADLGVGAAGGASPQGAAATGGRLLLYAMYDIRALDRAPKVRIEMMSRAFERQAELERISGGRGRRAIAAFAWLLRGGPKRIDAVYVESATSTAMPTDLLFLAIVKSMHKPVGIYFRDAYQLYRKLYPRTKSRQILADWAWRMTLPLMRRLAVRRYVPSEGLAAALKIPDPILLPPGTDPDTPFLGASDEPIVAYVGGTGWADGFDQLVEAMAIVRRSVPEAKLRVVTPPLPEDRRRALPGWVEDTEGGRNDLPRFLAEARMCVVPRPRSAYTDFATPVKLWDYLSFGKPVVTTDTPAAAAVVVASRGGVVVPDGADGIAAGILRLLEDPELAHRLAADARAYACAPGSTWDDRAAVVLMTLGVPRGTTVPQSSS